MELKNKGLNPKPEAEVVNSKAGHQEKKNAKLIPKIILGASVVIGLMLGSFVFLGGNSIDGPSAITENVKVEKVLSSYSYEQFPIAKVKNISTKADLPIKLKNIHPNLLNDLIGGKSELRTIKIYDFLENDGDVVEIIINNNKLGFYDLTNAEQEISVPFYKNSLTQIKVKAVDDGGGGVTFGMKGTQGEFKTKVMQLGETFSWEFSR